MKAPDGARTVAIRGKGIMGRRVAVVIGDRVHLWRGCDPNGIVAWHQTGRPLDTIEIIRDATKREARIGMAL